MTRGSCRWAGAMVVVALVALPAAAQFQASDLLYVPAVAHNEGVAGSVWRTDLYITNVDTVPIDVVMVYLPSGLQTNSIYFNDRSTWLGGRESDGVGFVNEELADIPPRGTVLLHDVVGEYWLDQLGLNGLGGMVVFAQEAGSLQDDGSRVYRNAIVTARIYNETTIYEPDPENEGEYIEVPVTYGQDMPAIPWYNLADPAAISGDVNFSYEVLTAGVVSPDFRYNVGILNASDALTAITVAVKPYQSDGQPFVDDQGADLVYVVTLPALAHLQYNQILAALGISDTDRISMQVSFVRWTSSSDTPRPAFTCYGSVVDNASNDPTTILPSFAYPFNSDCMFPDAPAAVRESKNSSTGPAARGLRRPLAVPPRGPVGVN